VCVYASVCARVRMRAHVCDRLSEQKRGGTLEIERRQFKCVFVFVCVCLGVFECLCVCVCRHVYVHACACAYVFV